MEASLLVDENGRTISGASGLIGLFQPPSPLVKKATAKRSQLEGNVAKEDHSQDRKRGDTENDSVQGSSNDNDNNNSTGGGTLQSTLLKVSQPQTRQAPLAFQTQRKIPPTNGPQHLLRRQDRRLEDISSNNHDLQQPLLLWNSRDDDDDDAARQKVAGLDPENEHSGGRGRLGLSSSASSSFDSFSYLVPIEPLPPEEPVDNNDNNNLDRANCRQRLVEAFRKHLKLSTFVGAGVFLLYHVVFCLALGSTIRRPHSSVSTLGIMSKTAAMGVIMAGPVYVFALWRDIPALYPTVDLFLAPFLARMGQTVDQHLYREEGITDSQVFWASFGMVSGIGLLTAALLIMLASRFKLANLGSYLPYPVLCGFFTAVGVSMWSLAFTVDTDGRTWQSVFVHGTRPEMWHALLHHSPSFLVAVAMKYFGGKSPLSVSFLVILTIGVFYIVLVSTGTSLDQAIQSGWFWSSAELEMPKLSPQQVGLDGWLPPQPFGVLNSWRLGNVHWGAVKSGLREAFTLSFLYLLRCTLHGTAMKKNVPNLRRVAPPPTTKDTFNTRKCCCFQKKAKEDANEEVDAAVPPPIETTNGYYVGLPADQADLEGVRASQEEQEELQYIEAKPVRVSIARILKQYAYSVGISALMGSVGVAPSVAASSTMYSLGAEGVAPQIGSILLLVVIYITNFKVVLYVPKAAFSCLIVLAAIDIFITWMYRSYQKTKEKTEWLVAPLIVVFASVVGLLDAVFLGIAVSTFLFVAAFFRSGVVKFLASGLTVRSTIERSIDCSSWLDENGDLIQIIVLQNYLFFGNASSILSYVSSMFEEAEEPGLDYDLPPMPKHILLDLTLVTGIDTSSVDAFVDMKDFCSRQDCKLFVVGLSPSMRSTLAKGNFKPEGGQRAARRVRFFMDLDTALGVAEDDLLREENFLEDNTSLGVARSSETGFQRALRKIDEQHGKDFAMDLVGFEQHTLQIDLEPQEYLYENDGGLVAESERGLFFIESGVVRIERDTSVTMTRGCNNPHDLRAHCSQVSLNGMRARLGTIGKFSALVRGSRRDAMATEGRIRLARIGPGWVVGATEGVGAEQTGTHIAVTKCRLHLLPFSKIQEMEGRDPALVLRLYKLLSHLTARREATTIGQLVTLHSIMTSPPHRKPLRRGHTQ